MNTVASTTSSVATPGPDSSVASASRTSPAYAESSSPESTASICGVRPIVPPSPARSRLVTTNRYSLRGRSGAAGCASSVYSSKNVYSSCGSAHHRGRRGTAFPFSGDASSTSTSRNGASASVYSSASLTGSSTGGSASSSVTIPRMSMAPVNPTDHPADRREAVFRVELRDRVRQPQHEHVPRGVRPDVDPQPRRGRGVLFRVAIRGKREQPRVRPVPVHGQDRGRFRLRLRLRRRALVAAPREQQTERGKATGESESKQASHRPMLPARHSSESLSFTTTFVFGGSTMNVTSRSFASKSCR